MPAPKILVVDDDAMVLRLVTMALELDGFNVVTATNGEEGLRRARDDRPDALVLDVMMPKLDGLSVTRALKGDAETASIPIVLCSAKTSENDKSAGIAAGADDYVTKPFKVKALVERVNALVAGARSASR